MSIAVVFALIAFAGVFLFFLGISQMRRSAGGSEDFQARLAAYGVTTAGAQALPQSQGMRDTLNRLFSPAAERMGRGNAKKGKPSVAEQLQRADLKLRPSEYFMIQLGSGILVGLIAYWRWGLIFGGLFLLGYLAPGFYVKYRVGQRLKKFNNQLGDTIAMLANSLRSGYSMLQSMDLVGREMAPPISDEFQRVTREVGLGLTPEEALANLVRRINSMDLELMVTAINVQREVGGNLAEILDIIANTIRERVKLQGEIKTLTAQQTYQRRVRDSARISPRPNTAVAEILGDETVTGVRVRDLASGVETEVAVAGVFVYVGLEPNSEFLKGVLELDESGRVPTDVWMRTARAGLFAAGDIRRDSAAQAISAAGDGATAAIAAHRYLQERS